MQPVYNLSGTNPYGQSAQLPPTQKGVIYWLLAQIILEDSNASIFGIVGVGSSIVSLI